MPRLRAGRVILQFGDGGLILLAPSVEAAVARFLSDAEIRLEAGGIFVGSHRGPHVEITACTTPLPRDVRRPTLFDRRDPGHSAAALEAWTRSGGTETFVGEWHTHPVDDPMPSGLDRRTWASIMGRVPDPVVFLIAGRRSVWCAHGWRGELRRAAVLDGE